MKKNKIVYILIVVLAAFAVYYFFTNKKSTLEDTEGALADFAIEDTASIDKIFIADAKGEKITLSKIDNKWMVNGQYEARPDNIRLLMKTFFRISVKMPVPKSAFNVVVKNIATGATKVEIYQGKEKPSKVYYVGGPTLNHQGTYMLLEEDGVKSTIPYIMHIPGFYGYLSTRFFTNAQQWRDAVVFKYQLEEIKRIEVQHHETPEESYAIEKEGNQLKLLNGQGVPLNGYHPQQLQNYVERYQKVYYEMIDEESTKEEMDSILATPPYISITVHDVSGKANSIVLYHMPNFKGALNWEGQESKYDVDRMYGYLNNDLFVYTQLATFDQLTLPQSYFFEKK
ncbi:MAG: hypothetical protein J5I47_10025 [Vicingus serpentipes]|nr:hypothetical protein [Vicingus serpentipes]